MEHDFKNRGVWGLLFKIKKPAPSLMRWNSRLVGIGLPTFRYGGFPLMLTSRCLDWILQWKSLVGTLGGRVMYKFTSSSVWSHSNTFCPETTKQEQAHKNKKTQFTNPRFRENIKGVEKRERDLHGWSCVASLVRVSLPFPFETTTRRRRKGFVRRV